MSNLMQRVTTNWHLMRIMRLGIGIMMLVMGIQSKDWALGLFSGFFLYQAITDTGCCSSAGCNTPRRGYVRPPLQQSTEIVTEYEEIK